jgi:hypothetical protein
MTRWGLPCGLWWHTYRMPDGAAHHPRREVEAPGGGDGPRGAAGCREVIRQGGAMWARPFAAAGTWGRSSRRTGLGAGWRLRSPARRSRRSPGCRRRRSRPSRSWPQAPRARRRPAGCCRVTLPACGHAPRSHRPLRLTRGRRSADGVDALAARAHDCCSGASCPPPAACRGAPPSPHRPGSPMGRRLEEVRRVAGAPRRAATVGGRRVPRRREWRVWDGAVCEAESMGCPDWVAGDVAWWALRPVARGRSGCGCRLGHGGRCAHKGCGSGSEKWRDRDHLVRL